MEIFSIAAGRQTRRRHWESSHKKGGKRGGWPPAGGAAIEWVDTTKIDTVTWAILNIDVPTL